MQRMQELKAPIRAFMREHYTDERLAMLLAHAQGGKLSFASCCCFIGVPTADHPLRTYGRDLTWDDQPHYLKARQLPGAHQAEMSYFSLGDNERRRRILIPIIRAEMKRRELLAESRTEAAETLAVEK